MSKQFLLDANVFIEAKNRYYGFDICPGFWDSIAKKYESERVFSIDRIRDELSKQDDEIKDWIDANSLKEFFKTSQDQAVIVCYSNIMNWVNKSTQFQDGAKSEFATVADGWLVAYAQANNMTVVTHEIYAPDVKRKVPIPNICEEFDIEYLDTFEMLRDLGVSFLL